MSLLTVNAVTSGYGDMEILHGVSIEVGAGEIVTVIGPNGAGKSTLMKTIFGLLTPTAGQITFAEEEITGLSPDLVVRQGMAYVPQVENIFSSLTVHENLEMGAFILTDDFSGRLEEIYDLFPILKDRRKQRVGKMSGGERQMVAMGRALMLDVAILIVEQNAKESLKLSNRGYVLASGRNRFEDTGENLLANEEVGQLYLGG
jgi:ABC-type branched-subunit amino acid transport system ATPase component